MCIYVDIIYRWLDYVFICFVRWACLLSPLNLLCIFVYLISIQTNFLAFLAVVPSVYVPFFPEDLVHLLIHESWAYLFSYVPTGLYPSLKTQLDCALWVRSTPSYSPNFLDTILTGLDQFLRPFCSGCVYSGLAMRNKTDWDFIERLVKLCVQAPCMWMECLWLDRFKPFA